MEQEIDLSILDTGTPEEIDAFLDSLGEVNVVDEPTDTFDSANNAETSAAEQTDGDTASADSPTATDSSQPVASGILSKDGQHVIPYDVLESERQAAKQLREQLQQQQQELDNARTAQQQLEIRNKQLEEYGIEPRDLPGSLDITPEKLAELQEDYPEVGGVLAAMFKQVNDLQQRVTAQPTFDPVAEAMNANPKLVAWQNGDPDRWAYAQRLDDQLLSDPAFKDAPLAQRFAEVAKRTEAAFGGSVPAAPQAAPSLPASPSDVGVTNVHVPDQSARIAAMDYTSLCDSMATMSDDDIDALLFSAGM